MGLWLVYYKHTTISHAQYTMYVHNITPSRIYSLEFLTFVTHVDELIQNHKILLRFRLYSWLFIHLDDLEINKFGKQHLVVLSTDRDINRRD